MNKELDNIFLDVRNAFRLLSVYQSRVLDTVNYIREQSLLPGIWGRKRFSNAVRTCKNSYDKDYATLKIENGMWAWDFLYGYEFEYYMGAINFGQTAVDFSILQISDDGFFRADPQTSDKVDVGTFADADNSRTELVFIAGNSYWMQSDMDVHEADDDFLHKFLASGNEQFTLSNGKKKFFAIKKYNMTRFATQQGADEVIRDFGQLVRSLSGCSIFKEQYYDKVSERASAFRRGKKAN